jgi:hypothetical protein
MFYPNTYGIISHSQSCLFTIHFNIILRYPPRPSSWCFRSGSPTVVIVLIHSLRHDFYMSIIFWTWCLCDRASLVQRCKQPKKMQKLFRLLIFLNEPYMFRATNSPILKSTFWLYIQLLRWNVSSISTVTPVGSSVGALHLKLYIESKRALEDGRICRPKHVGLN